MENWQQQLNVWQSVYLPKHGRYCGLSYGDRANKLMVKYGFPYTPGEYVPIDKRYSAMLQWQWAMQIVLQEHWEEIKA